MYILYSIKIFIELYTKNVKKVYINSKNKPKFIDLNFNISFIINVQEKIKDKLSIIEKYKKPVKYY